MAAPIATQLRSRWRSTTLKPWLGEPLLHFFVLAAGLFLAHHLFVGDARAIRVSAGTRASVARHFRDQVGRAPTAAELGVALREWKRDEALYREALREQLDREDPVVRTALVDKMRARALLQAAQPSPTPTELQEWLKHHRAQYESPRRYSIEWLSFPRAQHGSSLAREKLGKALGSGVDARVLGQPLYGATLTEPELQQKFGARFVDAVASIPFESWQRLDNGDELFLLRLTHAEGGLPPVAELRPRLLLDCSQARQEEAAHRLLDQIAARYRLEQDL